ncbi:cobaltochelatase subunit CobN [Synechococcus sp. CS-602]|uniref:cobaltochelatase subunit CobN n=1 Tax=Synechococcaceae TaxID=1890426 RepID=UPI0008FF5D68|nr:MULTISPECIES: cobaltochelatase subunit CobN [Synechococcaceae]MCT4364237.1 cobaltochelatase subunit CobN [Candidatus Regnicoccus frigidus MAG-AL1]APD48946.1 cobaltochelatase subunit CobN [Synechococcus sp. SynAce01]MCT0204567.1 cobaltochelatase subunit CobN [Synechococcus sp. CS-602]MCT0246375.1 cobaltochelatase subunit CobN [Synechococcus sp. CS-601]MCT4367117.1 cobaltochelatase subunit CobN [Candidatus Regnicoccus frigidus MAG-AL2]
MHRLASVPGLSDQEEGPLLVEQPSAPLLVLSSADSDLQSLADLLASEPALMPRGVRGLNLSALLHPAAIDHYLSTSLASTEVVLVRLLGGRGHWSYGLERLGDWAAAGPKRQLLVVAGTAEEEVALASLGTVEPGLSLAIGHGLREGGRDNLRQVLIALGALMAGLTVEPPAVVPLADPLAHDWRQDPGPRVGLVLYRALWQAGDTALVEATLLALRGQGLCPRALWVSGLRDPAVQRGVADLLGREQVEVVLCGTSFASVQFEEAGLGAPLWEALNVPVLQLLCSTQGRDQWQRNSIGLGPLDLSLQVALPELDGRITTRVGAFKELLRADQGLTTALYGYRPDPERLDWIAQLLRAWVELRQTPPAQKRVALVLANYPNRNSRVANGVGLDTPASTALMLSWLQEAGHNLGAGPLPESGDALIQLLLAGRSNDPESSHRPALDHLPLATYQAWYATLPARGRAVLEARWGPPEHDAGLERTAGGTGFAIRGLRYGAVMVLIQPERGYDRDPSLSYHSPDLPPTHAYLALYLWMRQVAASQLVVHVGKHGNLEWLPGKGLGLSSDCFPEWALGPMPHLYPFIVNDPGEGSQAKRRAQAVILDHLTPPLGRAGLHGPQQRLETLLDEYWEARQLGAARVETLRQRLAEQLDAMALPAGPSQDGDRPDQQASLDSRLEAADGYLCELKEAQIRTGLHIYGTLPAAEPLAELLLCLARPPLAEGAGLTQALATDLGLALDPWADLEQDPLDASDRHKLAALIDTVALPATAHGRPASGLRCCGDAVELLEQRALGLLKELLLEQPSAPGRDPLTGPATKKPATPGPATAAVLERVATTLLPRLLACGEAERQAFVAGVAGERIAAGPAGAPTRGRPDLLPTGRNFYSVDLRGLPTEAAWDLGRRSAELLLELHLQEQGDDLAHLALSVWGTATMRNGGEDIGQALALMGVRPVWDGPTRRMVGLEVIPLSLLQRPRVDVTLRISGLFRDAFPQLIGWMNQATALVAALDEPEQENPLAASARREGHAARIYGSAPGAYGAGLQGLIDSGQWEQRTDLGEAYLNWSGWRYESRGGGSCEAVPDRAGLEQRLQQVEVVLHNQDNREHDLLDSDDYYQFQGGLSAATERVRGTAPALWFGDHSRHQRPRLHRLERELDKVLRSRVLNPRWIEGMKAHGYKGGFELAASLDYLFAYDASTGRVPDWSYGAICEQWLQSEDTLKFLRQANPWALRDMGERLLEAHNRGFWQGASEYQLEHLRQLVLSSESLVET